MLTIALPTGRLGNRVYKLFAKIGYECKEIEEDNRKLVFESPDGEYRYLMVKPSDVGIYVERGTADVGVVGKDVLMETNPDVYEILDLGVGACYLAVAAKRGFVDRENEILRVATKYPNCAQDYFSGKNRRIDIIKLNGSIELAPILGLSDVIFDIVETGTTLKENNLIVIDKYAPSSARLIANKSSYQFNTLKINQIKDRLSQSL